MNTNDPVLVYKKLIDVMPSIGFVNRKKRVQAFLKVTKLAQEMIDAEEMTEDEAMFVLSLMIKKSGDFRKAGMMTAMSLHAIPESAIKDVGFKYANQMRCNLQLHPVDDREPKAADE